MGNVSRLEEVVWAERRRNPQPCHACDGCFRRFKGFPPGEDDFDEDEKVLPDAGDVFKHCLECDYTVCEDCTVFENQGS